MTRVHVKNLLILEHPRKLRFRRESWQVRQVENILGNLRTEGPQVNTGFRTP